MAWALPLALSVRAGCEARRDPERATQLLAESAEGFSAAGLALHAAAAIRRRGLLLGGDEGRQLVASGESFMKSQRISNFERWTELLIPGF